MVLAMALELHTLDSGTGPSVVTDVVALLAGGGDSFPLVREEEARVNCPEAGGGATSSTAGEPCVSTNECRSSQAPSSCCFVRSDVDLEEA